MSSETLTPALSLEPASCGVCGSDEAEPVAVGEDFRTAGARDTYLAVRCSACGLIYLTPVPAILAAASTPASGAEALSGPLGTSSRRRVRRAIVRWIGGFPAGARLLMVESHAALQPDRPLVGRAISRTPDQLAAEPSQSAHGALLIGELEGLAAPVETLQALHRVLRPDARLLVVATNPDSLAGSLFRGRHWSGYDFPRCRTLADPATLRTLVARAGFEVDALSTLGDPGAWIESVGYLLRDWGARPRVARLSASGPFTMLAGALERLSALSGRGGLIRAVLRPGHDEGRSR
jgi:hypothetical protein